MRFRRKFTREFKLDAVQRLRAGEPAGLVVRSLDVSRQELYLPGVTRNPGNSRIHVPLPSDGGFRHLRQEASSF